MFSRVVLTSREFTGCLLSEPSRYTDTCNIDIVITILFVIKITILFVIIPTIILVIIPTILFVIKITIILVITTIIIVITTVMIQMPFSVIRATVYRDPSSLIT